MSSCRELDADELKKMGVEDPKHQNTILIKRPVTLPSLRFTPPALLFTVGFGRICEKLSGSAGFSRQFKQ